MSADAQSTPDKYQVLYFSEISEDENDLILYVIDTKILAFK